MFLSPSLGKAQVPDSVITLQQNDSILTDVLVNAFHSRIRWKATPVAISMISAREMQRYGNGSMVPVMNSLPGIRMEERSPASYRLSIRGSLLRSPFGVRNIKVYWNDIPLTDAGGNTYLNLIDLSQITQAAILKGPASSTYGAGTGGVLLLRSENLPQPEKPHRFSTSISTGANGYFQEQVGWQYDKEGFHSSLQQSHLSATGYREQSNSRRDMIKWEAGLKIKKHQFNLLAFYTDLFYQTPGGITLAQMQQNPKLSRQPAGSLPGAIQQQAAIYNKTVLGALQYELSLNEAFKVKAFFSSNHSSIKNPFITNYETRDESNVGAGSSIVYEKKSGNHSFQWVNGLEWLYNDARINNYGNRSGIQDTVQFKDVIFINQAFVYSQMQWVWQNKWYLNAGISINNQSFRFKRITDNQPNFTPKDIEAILTPRLALSYRINKEITLYAIAAKGFSPPALAELRPSDGNFYGNLQAESGWNFETGLKGELLQSRLVFDIATYYFSLQNAIVRRNNTAGAEYFLNAGSTRQNGLETMISFQAVKHKGKFINSCKIWSSYSFQPYLFTDYQQGNIDYSGKQLTGVPQNIWVKGMDLETSKGLYANISWNSTSSLPLNDANDVFADSYQLVQTKLGFRQEKNKQQTNIFCGIDNLLNKPYSLGNDINAAGRRYYNPAAGINFFAGISYNF